MTWLEPIDRNDAKRFVAGMRHQADDAREELAEQVASLSRQLREVVEPRLKEARELVRHEAPIIADAAIKQASRMARRAKNDPVPVVVGAIGVVLLASLILGRRRT